MSEVQSLLDKGVQLKTAIRKLPNGKPIGTPLHSALISGVFEHKFKTFFLAVEIRMFVCYCFLFVIENPEKTIEILELLLKNGADLEAGIGSGETPL